MEAPQTGIDHNNLGEIEDLRVERMPENAFKQIQHKQLLKVIILGDTGKQEFTLESLREPIILTFQTRFNAILQLFLSLQLSLLSICKNLMEADNFIQLQLKSKQWASFDSIDLSEL